MSRNGGASDLATVVRHAGWLRRLAGELVRDTDVADDVVQATLIRAWDHPPQVGRDVRPWLAQVARNQARDVHRSERRRSVRENETLAMQSPGPPGPEAVLVELDMHRAVARAVDGLAEPFRQTVVLRFFDGLTAAEIARRLTLPAGTVRWRLKEALDRLRAALDRQHDGDRRRWAIALLPLARPSANATRPRRSTAWRLGVLGAAGLAGVLAVAVTLRSFPRSRTTSPSRVLNAGAAAVSLAPSRWSPPRFVTPTTVNDAPSPPTLPEPNALLRQLLTALAEGSYEDFLRYASDHVKAGLDKAELDGLASEIGPRIAAGYTADYLGPFRAAEHRSHVWIISFADGGDQVLVRLLVSGDRYVAFFVH